MIQLSLVAVSIVLIGLQCRRLTDKGLRPLPPEARAPCSPDCGASPPGNWRPNAPRPPVSVPGWRGFLMRTKARPPS